MATNFRPLTEKDVDKIREVLVSVGMTTPTFFDAHDREGNAVQIVIPEKQPTPDSFEVRKAAALAKITNREPIPPYASYGNNNGSLYIYHRTEDGRWVTSHVNFYEVIEAVARRILKARNTP